MGCIQLIFIFVRSFVRKQAELSAENLAVAYHYSADTVGRISRSPICPDFGTFGVHLVSFRL